MANWPVMYRQVYTGVGSVQGSVQLHHLGLAQRQESAIHWCVRAAQKQTA